MVKLFIRENVPIGKFVWMILAAVLAAVLSCGGGVTGTEDPLYWDLWVIDNTKDYINDPSAWYTINAKKKAVSDHAVIYVDVTRTEVTDAIASTLAAEFDAAVYPQVTQYFAAHYDVDGNGRVILLIYDIRDGYTLGGAYIGGYFFSIDYYSDASVRQVYPAMHSNESDLVYIDCNPQDVTGEDVKRTIAHEFQHMVNFSNSVERNKDFTDTWIDEGLAEAANHRCYGWDTSRLASYNADSGNYIRDGHPLFYWDDSNSLPNYAKSYLFFQYLRIQSSSGWSVYHPIFTNPYGDYRAVQAAMNSDTALSTWGSDSTERFNKLVLRWYAANRLNLGSGIYGYKGEAAVSHQLYSSNTISNLRSGGGVVKSMGADFSNPDSSFIYLSVSADGSIEDFDSTYTDLDYFIAVYKYYDVDNGGNGSSQLPASSVINISSTDSLLLRSMSRSAISQKPQKIDLVVPKFLKESPGK